MKELKFPIHFFEKNRENFIKKLPVNCVAIVCSSLNQIRSRDTLFPFRQDSNFFYLTGLEMERSILLIHKFDGGSTTYLYRKETPAEMVQWIGASILAEEIEEISGIKKGFVKNINRVDEIFDSLFINQGVESVAMYNEPYSGEAVLTYTQALASKLKKKYSFITIRGFNSIITELRDVKNKYEIKMIRRAVEITKLSIESMLKKVPTYKNEREIEAELIYGYFKYGGSGHAFAPIVAAGKNGTILHYEHNNSKIGTNDFVLIDTGAEYKNYASDISRTFPAKGKFSPKQREYYNVVLNAHNEAVRGVKAGVTYKELQEITKESLFKGLKDLKILKRKEDLFKYYYHGVSHSMGLDVHDVTPSSGVLKVGNVITIEPGIYIAEKGVGIRLENDILVTKEGHENLSKDIVIDPDEIEELINK